MDFLFTASQIPNAIRKISEYNPTLWTYTILGDNNKVIIPSRVYEEIIKHTYNPELESRTKESLEKINELYKVGYIAFKGEETDNFADNVF